MFARYTLVFWGFWIFPDLFLSCNDFAAQLKNTLNKEVTDVNKKIKTGNFKVITKWLNEKIHMHGNKFLVDEILLKVSGQKLNQFL